MNVLDKVILDADICLKLGRFERVQMLEQLIPRMCDKAYIHRYVHKEEVLIPQNAKRQLDNLINDGKLEILDETALSDDEREVYYSNISLLSKVMKGTEKLEDSEHRGEIVSLSMAKVLNIPIFISDEKDLQTIIDSKLNTGMGTNIEVFRLINIINWIKNNPECGINRKLAKLIWCGSHDRKKVEFYKNLFDDELWKL